MAAQMNSTVTTRPDPDPTLMTTESLLRETGHVEDLFEAKLTGVRERIGDIAALVRIIPETRGQDIAHLESLIVEKFQTIREKFAEKFTAIDSQFKDRDTRVEQTAKAGAQALSAALQAAKEAVGEKNKANDAAIEKSEKLTTKLIDALNETIKGIVVANDKAIADLKDRMNRYEGIVMTQTGAREGSAEQEIRRRATTTSTAQIVGIAAATIVGLLSMSIALFAVFHTVATH